MPLVESPFFFSKNQVIQAGAGTGKTHTLVTQYLHLCLGATAYKKPLDPAGIVVVTFTDKAAAELKDRLSARLQRMRKLLSESSPDSWTDKIEQAEPELARTIKPMGILPQIAARIDEVLLQLETAPVGTFHSFAANLLHRYSNDKIGSLFELLLPGDAFELERTTARQVLLRAVEGGYENPQLSVVLSTKEAKELISQFGFYHPYKGGGLPEMIVSVNARIREEGKPLMQVFSTSQMDECQRYVPWMCLQAKTHIDLLCSMQGELGKNSVGLWKECEEKYQVLFSFFSKAPSLSQFLQQQESVLSMWQQFCSDLSSLRSQKQELSQKRLASIKDFFKQALKEATAILTSEKAQPLLHALQKICVLSAQAYQKEKQDNHRLDFSDLLLRARDLLLKNPDVCMQVKAQVKVILVDEFQDTSPLQSEILSLLSFGMPLSSLLSLTESVPEKEEADLAGKIAIVGDRKQSIYQFRGADVASFLEISQKLLQMGAQQTVLQQSRRSLPGLLDFSNAFFSKQFVAESSLVDLKNGTEALWRVLWDPFLDPLLPCREPQSDSCVELLLPTLEQAHEQDPLRREALLIATRIQHLIESGRSPSQIAILFRRMTHLPTYLDVLSQQGIKTNVVHGRGYYQTREVWDLLLALVLIAEPENQLALFSVLRSPLIGLFDDHLVLLKQSGRLSLSSLCSLDENEIPSLSKEASHHLVLMSKLFSHLAMCADRMGPATVLSAVLTAADFLQILEALPFSSQRLANVEQLLQMAQDFEMQGQSFQEFVALMRNRMAMDPATLGVSEAPLFESQADEVQIMTIHQSKGLEFPVVIIAGCAFQEPSHSSQIRYDSTLGLGISIEDQGERKDTFASLHILSRARQKQAAESLRLLYVAVTRARDQVIFAGEGLAKENTWRFALDAFLQSDKGHLIRPVFLPAASLPKTKNLP